MVGTVVLAVADESTRQALRAALARSELVVVAEKNTAQRALGAVLVHRPSVCLIDVDLPGELDVTIRSMLEIRPESRIGVLARQLDQPGLLRAVRAGADGVLLTTAQPAALASGIDALVAGEQLIPSPLAERLASLPTAPPPPDRPPAPVTVAAIDAPPVVEAPPAQAGTFGEDATAPITPLPPRSERRRDVVSEGRLRGMVMYTPRFARHLHRRIQSDVPLGAAVTSARSRMRDYRPSDD
jgi:DNA-binding NarL/FixJ family response regulator